jgi:hypothetical protein
VRRQIVLFAITAALFAFDVHGASMQSRGEHLFGPDTSENRACELAEQRARKAAIQKKTGELVVADDLMVCSEKEETSCNLNRMTLSTTNGVIRKVKKLERKIVQGTGGHKKCVIILEVDVGEGTGRYDPNFDMGVQMNNRTFRSGETMKISVAPTAPMYISVFLWLPWEKTLRQVQKIFPNELDQNNFFQNTTTIPTKAADSHYDLAVRFPEGVKGQKDRVDEYLMVVGTRTLVNFQRTYALEGLNSLLLEIPRSDQRVVRKGYLILQR